MPFAFICRIALLLLLTPLVSSAATLTAHVLEPGGAAVRDSVVYAMPVGSKPSVHAPRSAVIDQINRMFVPLVSVIETGTSVTFPNNDNIRHQVYSFSPAKTFVLKLYSGVPAEPVVFDKPGLVVLGCNIHDRMVAYLQVVDTPWFGKTGPDGMVRLDLPSGDYDVHVWHFREIGDDEVRRVTVQADSTLSVMLKLKPAAADSMQP
jgi:plastocyanin